MRSSLSVACTSTFFLLNEVVLNLDSVGFPRRMTERQFRALSFTAALRLGQELYAEHPLLHHDRPETAMRLALLLAAKAPAINGALFLAPGFGCAPEEVSVRLADTAPGVMIELYHRQRAGLLDTISADRHVWRRLAA